MTEIWYDPEAEFIGATGVETPRELAELLIADGNEMFVALLANGVDGDEASIEDIESALDFYGVHVMDVDDDAVDDEQWTEDDWEEAEWGSEPAVGTTRVIGVSL